ncbi:MAG TPA: hypothetical protein VHI13_11760 [Candidatus Kapabacteria bacterium]|nr:hypothetical protein [Candidatus Kapabacteria bacterium]
MTREARYIRTSGSRPGGRPPGARAPGIRAGLADFCLDPWSHELKCFGITTAHDQFTDAITKAEGRVPSACASKIDAYMQKAIGGDDWSTLSGGEYQWLNRAWRGLIYNDLDPPSDCLAGPEPGAGFQPGRQWTPPPGDPQPPANVPWGWIGAGAGVLGIAALYWFAFRTKTGRK